MPWVNLDQDFPDHPKVDGLSDSAFRLHVAGICYANKHMTDGLIPAERVKRLVPRFRQSAMDELTDRCMWLPTAAGWRIHDYLEWNKSREEIESKRERQSKGGKRGARQRWMNV